MTREEAIQWLTDIKNVTENWSQEVAIDMAIEALSADRPTDDEINEAYFQGYKKGKSDERLFTERHTDRPSVVRCKDCRHSRVYQTDSKGTMQTNCVAFVMPRTVNDDDYCSWGERRKK